MRSLLRTLPRPLRQFLNWYLQLPLWLTGATALTLVVLVMALSGSPGRAQLPPPLPAIVPPNAPNASIPSAEPRITISPAQPILGDTISVTLAPALSSNPAVPNPAVPNPSVTLNGKAYPMFGLSDGRYRALIPTTPRDRPGNLSFQINHGTVSDRSVKLGNRTFPTQSIWLSGGQDGSVSDAEYDRVDAFKRIVSPEKRWNGKLLRPNNGPVTSQYGIRRYYNGVFADDYFHRGVDYGGNVGSAIIAPAAGRVVLVGYERDGFPVHGNCVGLDHGQGVTSIYIHLSQIKVQDGEVVQAGQTIGTLGSTGSATGPHLHWGLFVHGEAVDPVPWREQGFE
jgi:murein DD-endopeptidase MepM/ murein hydrolase activator NlpD